MADLFKVFLLLIVVFFLVSNSKADKSAIEEGIVDGNSFPGGSEYNYVLPSE